MNEKADHKVETFSYFTQQENFLFQGKSFFLGNLKHFRLSVFEEGKFSSVGERAIRSFSGEHFRTRHSPKKSFPRFEHCYCACPKPTFFQTTLDSFSFSLTTISHLSLRGEGNSGLDPRKVTRRTFPCMDFPLMQKNNIKEKKSVSPHFNGR